MSFIFLEPNDILSPNFELFGHKLIFPFKNIKCPNVSSTTQHVDKTTLKSLLMIFLSVVIYILSKLYWFRLSTECSILIILNPFGMNLKFTESNTSFTFCHRIVCHFSTSCKIHYTFSCLLVIL